MGWARAGEVKGPDLDRGVEARPASPALSPVLPVCEVDDSDGELDVLHEVDVLVHDGGRRRDVLRASEGQPGSARAVEAASPVESAHPTLVGREPVAERLLERIDLLVGRIPPDLDLKSSSSVSGG